MDIMHCKDVRFMVPWRPSLVIEAIEVAKICATSTTGKTGRYFNTASHISAPCFERCNSNETRHDKKGSYNVKYTKLYDLRVH